MPADAKFTLIGTVRGAGDEQIVENLKKQALKLGISHKIDFAINQTRDKLFEYFQKAKVAIHTMEYEHFGIAVVELMSSGIITIAHNSAGPKADIIGASKKDPVGYLGDSVDKYAEMATQGMIKYEDDFHSKMRVKAR